MRGSILLLAPICLQAQVTPKGLESKLLDAAARCDVQSIQVLLAQGVNPDARLISGETSLIILARHATDEKGRLEAVKALLAAGARIEARDKDGMTPLLACLEYARDLTMANLLLASHANLDAQDATGRTAVMMMAPRLTEDNGKLWAWLAPHKPNLELIDKAGETVLLKAAASDYPPQSPVDLLLKAGANLKARNLKGQTALHMACSKETSQEIVIRLLAAGADPNADDFSGITPLHMAVLRSGVSEPGKPTRIQLLLKAGAIVGRPDHHGSTALSYAAVNGNHDAVEQLLAAGCPVSTRDADGDVPFTDAILQRNYRIAHRLLKAGAHVEDHYRGDWNALAAALKAGRPGAWDEVTRGDAAELAKGRGGLPMAWTWAAFNVAAMKGDRAFFESAARAGIALPMPDPKDSEGVIHHPLTQLAAAFGQGEILDYLQGASIAFPPKDGRDLYLGRLIVDETTPEALPGFLAWEARHPDLADPRVDMMDLAALRGLTGILEVLLKQPGAAECLKGAAAAKLLFQAADNHHWDTVRLLLKAGAAPELPVPVEPVSPVQDSFWNEALKQDLSAEAITDLILLAPKTATLPCSYCGTILWSQPVMESPEAVRRLLAGGIPREAFLKGPHGTVSPIVSGKAHPEVARQVLGAGIAGLDDLDADGLPPVARATTVDALLGLVKAGAKVTWKGKDGKACHLLHHLLDRAENESRMALAFLDLPEAAPQVSAKDGKGRLPLGIAAAMHPTVPWCGTGYDGAAHLASVRTVATQLLQRLLKAGARPDALDGEGRTPLERATESDEVLLQVLLAGSKPLPGSLRKKLVAAAVRTFNAASLRTLVADPTLRDPLWPWAEWLDESLGDSFRQGAETARVIRETGLVSLAQRREAFWRHGRSWDADRMVQALDLGSLKPDATALALFDAARKGDASALRTALGRAPVDARDETGATPLMAAVKAGHLEAVQLLLKAGANSRALTLDQEGPLHIALKGDRLDIAEALLVQGKADPDQPGPDGAVPLVRAILDRRHATVFFLLKHGVDPRSVAYQTAGNAPLNAAARMGDLELMRFFVEDCHMDPLADQASHEPAWKDYPQGTTTLSINGAQFQMIGFNTPLVAAIHANQCEAAAWLVKRGATVTDTKDNNLVFGMIYEGHAEMLRIIAPVMPAAAFSRQLVFEYAHEAPILLAIENNRVDILRILLEAGFPPQQRCTDGTEAIQKACEANKVEVLQMLLATGKMDLTQGDEKAHRRYSPLQLSVLRNHPDCVKALLDAGANPREVIMDWPNHQVSGPGQTLIHEACNSYYRADPKAPLGPLIRLLVTKAGLDINQREAWEGKTALDYASGPGNAELAAVIRELGGKRGEELGPWKKP